MALLLLTTAHRTQAQVVQTFNATGAPETFTVPAGVTSLSVVAFGAQGGDPGNGAGLGGKVEATLTVTPGQVLTITVGGAGGLSGAGFNGGGNGSIYEDNDNQIPGGGGGTDIRVGGNSLTDRILVAGGGGGGSTYYNGGNGGGLEGASGGYKGGTGGTQSAGGTSNGASGIGGNSVPATEENGGGGGGYYGGGGSSSGYDSGGGGGGSSYPNPATPPTGVANVIHTQGVQSGNGLLTIRYFPPPTRLYVNAAQTANPGDGLTWPTAYTSLQEALTYPNSISLTEIWVAGGVYKPTTGTDQNISFAMLPGVAIYGGFAGTETDLTDRVLTYPSSTTLSGDIGTVGSTIDNSRQVVLAATAILDGVVVSDANGNGGLRNYGSNPILRNCLFINNEGIGRGVGGGITGTASLTLINCAFVNNTGGSDGGGGLLSNSTATLINCSFQGNTASSGGAIATGSTGTSLLNCVFWNNGGSNTLKGPRGSGPGAPPSPIPANNCLFDASVDPATYSGTNNLTTTTSPFVSTASVALRACSPAIDAGDDAAYLAAGGPDTDLAGQPRFVNANGSVIIDMGAIETQTATTVPDVLYVNATATAPGDGLSWATAFPDLQQALNYPCTKPFQQIWVANGTYKPTTDPSNRNATFRLTPDVQLFGGFAGTETDPDQRVLTYPGSTILSGDINHDNDPAGNSNQVVTVQGATIFTYMDGFVVRGGNHIDGGGHGGGIVVTDNRLVVVNSQFDNNIATGNGGAIYATNSVLSFLNTAFINNEAPNGGAVYSDHSDPFGLQFFNCSFQGNIGAGGAVAVPGTQTVIVSNSVFWNNGSANTFVNTEPVVANYSLFDAAVTGYAASPTNLTASTSPFVSATSIALNACSPAINAGSNAAFTGATSITIDLSGQPRTVNTTIDMGALEFQSSPVVPTRYYVKANASGANTGLNWTDAFTDLQSALTNPCVSNVTAIWVAGGTYKPTNTTSRTAIFRMLPGVAIYGGFIGTETTLAGRTLTYPSSTTLSGDIGTVGDNADNSYHVVYAPYGLTETAILDGFVITGGNANADGSNRQGGGMYNYYASPLIRNCLFQNNSADQGGAVYNRGEYGGGVSSPTFLNCSFQNNAASDGGAMYNNGMGGASSPALTNCSFQGNSSSDQYGGAVFYNDGSCGTSIPYLTNCVVFGNTGFKTFQNTGGFVNAINSLFDASIPESDYTSSPTNLTTSTSPFASTASVALNACTPAIDAGSNAEYTSASGPATDLAGKPRTINSTIDMGAIEFEGVRAFPVSITAGPVASSVVCAGAAVSVPVSITGGPATYQWYKGSFTSPVASQTTATLSLTSAQVGDSGSYTVIATGVCGSATSTAFSLTVNPAISLTLTPTSGTITCATPSITLTAQATGQSGLRWSDNSANATLVVSTSGVYSVSALSPGTCGQSATATISSNTATGPANLMASSLTFCAATSVTLTAGTGSNYAFSSSNGFSQSSASPTAVVSQGGTYSVIVTGVNGCTATNSVSLTQVSGGVALGLLAAGGAFCENTAVSIPVSVTASGATPTFQWYRNGQFTGQSTATLSFVAVTTADAGSYVLVATAACNSQTTAAYNLSVGTVQPTLVLYVPGSASVNVSGQYPTITLPSGQVITLQATGGASYDWRVVIDRLNGFEIRHTEQNATGIFRITQPGPYRLAVTGANGCERVFEGLIKY